MTENNIYGTARNPKILKNPKGYDRVRDRKSKQIFEYEDENEIDFEQNEENVLQSCSRNGAAQ